MAIEKDKLDALKLEHDARGRSGSPRSVWAVVIVLLLVAGGGAGAFWWSGSTAPPGVETARAVRAGAGGQSEAAVLQASGYVVARRLATISSKITGRISEVLIEEGMSVEPGQVLARLDDATALAQLDLANSQLLSARSSQAEIEVRLREAERTLSRRRSLVDDNLVSEAALDEAESEARALQARLSTGSRNVAVAERTVALRAQNLDDLVIRAPFAGVVVSKDAQTGEMISPVSAGGGFTRTGICTIVDMDSREVEVDVNEAYINRVKNGQRVIVQLDAYTDWDIGGSVINIVPTADRQRATVKVRIGFDELDGRVLPDMGVRVRFLEDSGPVVADGPSPISVIPRAALRKGSAETPFVWIVRDEQLERRAVRVGSERADTVDVLAGVSPGEVVVTTGPADLADGQRVTVN